MSDPVRCHPRAWEYFRAQLDELSTSTTALLRAAVAVSLHELRDLDPGVAKAELDRISDTVRDRAQDRRPRSLLAHLHEHLFEELGFTGNTKDYYNPANSYVSKVIESRQGLPITLCLIYKVIAERVGLEVLGINAPGHFMAAVIDNGTKMIVDPFAGGRVLSREDAFLRIEKVAKEPVPRSPGMLPMASHRDWIARLLRNLRRVFAEQGRLGDMGAMTELALLLEPSR